MTTRSTPDGRGWTRRGFLGACAGGSATLVTAPNWLAHAAGRARELDRVLVIVQLRGGNDGLNTVVPKENPLYYRARPGLGIPAAETLPLDDLHGFHPSLPRLARRYAEGGVGILRGVGYDGTNLSHFRSQDIWDSASLELPLPDRGWIGAWADESLTADASPLAMLALGRDVLPRAMRARQALACAVPSLDRYSIRAAPDGEDPAVAERRRRAIEMMNPTTSDGPLAPLSAAVRAARASIEELARTRGGKAGATYPGGKLARDLELAARVITEGLPTRFLYVTQDGYDTHANQPGPHRTLLADLDGALDAFLADLASHDALDRVLVMTISEFGRRVAQNGVGETSGSDHGAGSLQMFFGGATRPGLHGPIDDLENLDPNGNLVPKIDFRRSYATVIEDWFGGDSEAALGQAYEKVQVLS